MEVAEGSVAEKGGVVPDMQLVAVNGLSVTTDHINGLTGDECMNRIEQALGRMQVTLTLCSKLGSKSVGVGGHGKEGEVGGSGEDTQKNAGSENKNPFDLHQNGDSSGAKSETEKVKVDDKKTKADEKAKLVAELAEAEAELKRLKEIERIHSEIKVAQQTAADGAARLSSVVCSVYICIVSLDQYLAV